MNTRKSCSDKERILIFPEPDYSCPEIVYSCVSEVALPHSLLGKMENAIRRLLGLKPKMHSYIIGVDLANGSNFDMNEERGKTE